MSKRQNQQQTPKKILQQPVLQTTQPAIESAPHNDHYAQLHQQFVWNVPEQFNIAHVCCQRWASDPLHSENIAVYYEHSQGNCATLSYAQLQRKANQLSHVLQGRGIKRGDIVGCILPQRPETAISLIACLQMGVIAMPLSFLFGPEALQYRLQHSAACAMIIDDSGIEAYREIKGQCPDLHTLITLNCDIEHAVKWEGTVEIMPENFTPSVTLSSDPALLIYTSGTTGAPKGALLPHSAIIGNLPGFVASQNWFPQDGDIFWSPADWAWTGGLMDALLPTLYFGKPIVGYQGRFSAETAYYLMEKYQVTNTFLFPTALKMMMKAVPAPHEHYHLSLRAIMCAGEAVGDAVFDWCETALDITPNEMFGQTEMNYIVGNSERHWPAKPGSMGRAYPGHRVALIDDAGNEVADDETGEVALNRYDIHGHPDPVFFLRYWNNPAATEEKFTGDWCRTGDLASRDADGYLWYQGRADDMFKAAGYRIGPSEIENCLLKHAAVVNVAVVPKPDKERGNVVKAYVVLSKGFLASEELITELQNHVRGKLAPYEYPREIEFVAELPMTTSGKILRRVLRLQEEARALV
jgi:acetyl-CoA synthetase